MDLLLINLARSTDRRAFMEARLRQLGIDYEIFPGVDAVDGLPEGLDQYAADRCTRRFGAPLLPGEVGCYASHYRAWTECLHRNAPLAVLEDDVKLSSAFPEALALAEERAAEHRMIRLAGVFERQFRVIESIGETRQLVRFSRGPSGTQCYVLSPTGAEALLAGAQAWLEPVDSYLDRFWYHGLESKGILPFAAERLPEAENASLLGERRRRKAIGKTRREFYRVWDNVSRLFFNAFHAHADRNS
jgi:glycosyl transferase family 25